jgi:hypothetical protein
VSPYVSVPTRLRSSSGHDVDWRTGVDDNNPDPSSRVIYTQCQASVVELEHLKTKTRLKDEKFASVRGECET